MALKVNKPMGVDVSEGLLGTLGLCEFEKAGVAILRYLADDSKQPEIAEWQGERGEGWEKKMTVNSIEGVGPTLFAMLCASGWLENSWFPKGWFVVSKAFIERVKREV